MKAPTLTFCDIRYVTVYFQCPNCNDPMDTDMGYINSADLIRTMECFECGYEVELEFSVQMKVKNP